MDYRKIFFYFSLFTWPLTLHASFIESTIGTAVVNDATASFYNPAALTLLKNPQIITLGSIASLHHEFEGQATETRFGYTQSGRANTQTHYFLPSFYLSIPTTNNLTLGIAILSNTFNNDINDHSILRYATSRNSTQSIDTAPALGIKLNEWLSVGAGINISHAKFILRPIYGIPSLTIPDSQSHNQADGTGTGGDVGLLLKPSPTTLIGINYRSAITYRLSGNSSVTGDPPVVSHDYGYHFWTPASGALSINHFFNTQFGVITTIRRIGWHVFKQIKIHGIATKIGNQGLILNATVPYHLHDTWLLTLGSHYRVTPNWIIRVAGSYNQSPASGRYQISDGDSIILGASTGYDLNKYMTLDGSYAHGFIKNKNIHITNTRNIINGTNTGYRDGISIKLTFNIV